VNLPGRDGKIQIAEGHTLTITLGDSR
jgi:hypothetical protein